MILGHHPVPWDHCRELTVLLFSRVTYEDPQAVGGLASALDSRKQSSEVVGFPVCFSTCSPLEGKSGLVGKQMPGCVRGRAHWGRPAA